MKNPNFSDPRVRRRCLTALEFVEQYVFNTAKPIAQIQIHRHFGRSNDALGGYLKSQLLITADNHYNMLTGKCKTYTRNSAGYQQLKSNLGITTDIISPKLEQQLTTGEFEYVEKSHRWFNPLQQKPRQIRNRELASRGYCYDYDIDNASATLIYQYAQRLRLEKITQNLTEIASNDSETPLILPHIEQYLTEKEQIRNQIANDCGCDVKYVKKAITALFQGAHLSRNERSRLYWDLNANCELIERLKQNSQLSLLREDIKSLWRIIRGEIFKEKLTKGLVKEEEKSKWRLCGRDKAALYRQLEREVMSVIWRELKRGKIAHLKIHDGWASREICDMKLLVDKVRNKTGYHIRINWAIISQHI
jgi:hypothetical protein